MLATATNLALVMYCIALTETEENWNVVGKAGERGQYQQTEIFVRDLAQRYPWMGFTLDDRMDPKRSAMMNLWNWHTYCTTRRLHRTPTIKDFVQCLHQGPDWFKIESDEVHWQRFCAWYELALGSESRKAAREGG